MMLAGNGYEWVVIPAAVRHNDEDRVVAIGFIGFNCLDELLDPLIDHRNSSRVVAHVSPMYVVGIVVVHHEQLGTKMLQRPKCQFREKTVSSRIHQSVVRVVVTPLSPERLHGFGWIPFANGSIVEFFHLAEFFLLLLALFSVPFAFGKLLLEEVDLVAK